MPAMPPSTMGRAVGEEAKHWLLIPLWLLALHIGRQYPSWDLESKGFNLVARGCFLIWRMGTLCLHHGNAMSPKGENPHV